MEELELTEEVAIAMVNAASERARVVAEQQAKEKEEAEARRMEEEEAARRLLSGDGPAVEVDESAEAAADAILSMGSGESSESGSGE